MRVFVTGTGRCGSVSFREACRFAENYSTGHETKNGFLAYPDSHIEVNPQFRSCISILASKYPDAKWVHLMRERKPCAKSLSLLEGGKVMTAYGQLHLSIMPNGDPFDMAERFYDCENARISAELSATVKAENRLVMHLETIASEWAQFWKWIGATGDYAASLEAWKVKRNTTEQRLGIENPRIDG